MISLGVNHFAGARLRGEKTDVIFGGIDSDIRKAVMDLMRLGFVLHGAQLGKIGVNRGQREEGKNHTQDDADQRDDDGDFGSFFHCASSFRVNFFFSQRTGSLLRKAAALAIWLNSKNKRMASPAQIKPALRERTA